MFAFVSCIPSFMLVGTNVSANMHIGFDAYTNVIAVAMLILILHRNRYWLHAQRIGILPLIHVLLAPLLSLLFYTSQTPSSYTTSNSTPLPRKEISLSIHILHLHMYPFVICGGAVTIEGSWRIKTEKKKKLINHCSLKGKKRKNPLWRFGTWSRTVSEMSWHSSLGSIEVKGEERYR